MLNNIPKNYYKAIGIKRNVWVYGYYVKHREITPAPLYSDLDKHMKYMEEHTKHYIVSDGFSDWNMPRDLVFTEIDKDTLCQSVGVNDSEGVSVFENDMIDYRYFNGLLRITWDGNGFWVEINGQKEFPRSDLFRVIGNFFDPKEKYENKSLEAGV